MNPELIFAVTALNKKYVAIAAATLVLILAMPMVAVFALGQGTLEYLAGSLLGSDTTSSISTTTVGLYDGPLIAGDAYAWGNCTYWVFALRLKADDPIPTTWGNAATWAFFARLGGYTVNQTPSAGAIMQISDVDNGLGHVAYVTAVDPSNGQWTISEMNVKGLDVIDTKTYPASAANSYNFIHDKAS